MTPVASTIVALIRHEARRDPAAPAILAPGRAPLAYGALVERIVGRLFNRPTVAEFAAEVAKASSAPSRTVEDPIVPRARQRPR